MTINENKKLSRNRNRRIERKIKMDDNMKLLLNKIKTKKTNKNENYDKIKELEIKLVEKNYANNPNKLRSALKVLKKSTLFIKIYMRLKMKFY